MLPCQSVDAELFFGPVDSPAGTPRHDWELRALAVCAACPIQSRCLDWALTFPAAEQFGVVGGTTASERRVLLSQHQRATRKAVAA